jgi:bifunctional non-homologous end joining protein LigD
VVQLLDHVLGEGQKLFATACARDLEGIVAKRADSPYRTVGHPGWLEIKNPNCSQGEGRGELFER